MESITYSKNLKITPKKLRFLLAALKKLKPVEALNYLMYTPKRSAEVLYKVIKSALVNGKSVLKVDEKMLKFKHLSVEEGRKLKRFRPGGRGTARPILRRFAHIKIILEADTTPAKSEIRSTKSETKPKSKLAKSKSPKQ